VPAAGLVRLAFFRRVSRLDFATEWLKKRNEHWSPQAGVPPVVSNHHKEVVMNVMIGIDPHKASHTVVALDGAEDQLLSVKVRATSRRTASFFVFPSAS
jgi:hypothetical protein